MKVQLVDKYKFLIDPNYMTSFKYLVEQKQSFLYRVVNVFGKRHRILMYGGRSVIMKMLISDSTSIVVYSSHHDSCKAVV